VVCFKDDSAWKENPGFALYGRTGQLYREYRREDGIVWNNPYNREVWSYIAEIAVHAAKIGFEEIQLDYIRFPTDTMINDVDFPESMTNGQTKIEVISEFSRYIMGRLAPYPVVVSADIFGAPIYSDIDARAIGQDYMELLTIFDVLCPMIYPSHYGRGAFGVQNPDLEPYLMIHETLVVANEKRKQVIREYGSAARLRPWLQDFTASYLSSQGLLWQNYGGEQIADQIRACYDNGVYEWLLWNSRSIFAGFREYTGQTVN
jgi:hypothetical protein